MLRRFVPLIASGLLATTAPAQYVQLQKLPAAPATTTTFGASAAMEGSTLVVGANGDDNQTGAAYVYEKGNDGTWTKIARLTASDRAGFDRFGESVALSGNTIVVGANLAEPAGGEFNQGQAYVFVKPAGGWTDATETAILTLSDGVDRDEFGSAVAVSGDVVAVGVGLRNSPGTYNARGAVFLYQKPAGGWATTGTPTATITISDAADGDRFGSSVALDGNTLLAGAPNKNAAYVFEKPGGGWVTTSTFTAKLTGSGVGSGDFFGRSVALAGGTAVVGAPYEFVANAPNDAGATYVFVKPGGGWASGTETARLTASDGAAFDQFGSAVALAGDLVLVGAPFDDDKGNGAGSAYVFTKPAGGWATTNAFTAKLLASDGTGDPKAGGDNFGNAVAASAAGLAVGAPVHGANFSGAVYLFGPCPALAFGFSAQAGGSPVALDNASVGASATFSLCPSGSLTLAGFSSTPSSGVKFRRALTVTGTVNDNGSALSSATTVVDGSFFSGTLGPYALASGSSGSVVLVFTPFTDLNDNDQLDEGECTGHAITLTVNLGQPPSVGITNLASSYCANGNPVVLAGSPSGGTFSGPGVSSGVFTPANAGAGGDIQYAYTDPATGCAGTASQAVSVTPTAFSGSPTVSGVPVLAGQALTMNFAIDCPGSASFRAELSNASGLFTTPVNLGVVAPGVNSLTIPPNTPYGTGYRIRVLATNPSLQSDPSGAFTVNVVSVQSLTPSQAICPGQPFQVSVQATGSGLSYQWYRQVGCCLTQPIPGATGATASIPTQFLPGTYFAVITPPSGPPVASDFFTLTLKPPTLLRLTSPASQVCEGGSLTLSVTGSGPGSLSYAWTKDGQPVGSGPSLTLQNLQSTDAGTYACTLTSECSSVSVSVPVTVRYVRISQQPPATVNLCSGQTTLSVGVQAVGVTPTYQWRRNGTAISGATSASLTVLASRPGTYTVEVRTACGTVVSQGAVVGCGNPRLSAEEPTLVVAPNPVRGGEIRVRVGGMDSPEFGLTTAAGRSVGISVKTDGSGEWVLTPKQPLAAGVYVLRASEASQRLTTRVLVAEE